MKFFSLLLFVVFTPIVTIAQSIGGGANNPTSETAVSSLANGKISGVIIDSASRKPVEFATVALTLSNSDKPIDGAVCDLDGKFTITKIDPGTYNVVVSFIGYETKTIRNVKLEDNRDEVDLGTIVLSTSTKILNEVVVEGQKALIEERVDRTIYNAENDATAKGGDATDVLKRVPMLAVDLEGNVTMRGSQNIRVLINNKPSTIMASNVADALKQIPADQIKSVEVITSPSAKYDAEGSAGIINIITKKNNLEGLTLGIDTGIGLRGSNLGLNGNYRRNKMGFSLGGWGRANYNINGSFENSQTTIDSEIDNTPLLNRQQANTRSQGLFGNYTFGWDYDLNDKNYVSASVRFGARNNKNYQDDLLTELYEGNTLLSSSLRDAKTLDLSNNIDVNLTYTHLYEKPQRELSILGSYSINNRDNDFENRIKAENGSAVWKGIKNINDSYNEEITLQADYQSPVGDNQMIEFGAKDIARKVFSDFSSFTDLDGDGEFTPSSDTQLSNNLNYDQNVVAGYLSYTYTSKSAYSFKAGTRYEYTTIEAYSQTEDNIEIPSYGALVPSINISKKLTNGKTIKAAYNRRIQRPSIRFLNPNIQGSNPYDVTQGNPELEPEFSNNYEFSYSTFVKGTSLNFTTFWRNTNNSIQDVRNVEDVTTVDGTVQRVTTTFENIGQEDAYGLSIFGNVMLGKLMLNGGTDVYYAVLNNKNPEPQFTASNEGWVASYRLFGNYSLKKGWGVQFFGFYRGRQVQLQGTQGGFGIYSLGMRKEFNEKRGSVGLGAENFFTTAFKIRSELNSPLVDRKSLTVFNNMGFRVNFSYRIGKMSVDAKPRRSKSINNDDLKGGGGDGGGLDGGQPQQPRSGGGFTPSQAPANSNRGASNVNAAPIDTSAVVNTEGIWAYTIESPQGGAGNITIKKDGENYTGTITNTKFNTENQLSNVTVTGNQLSFNYQVSFGGNQMEIQVTSTITGDELNGSVTVGQFGNFPLNAKRAQ